MGDGTTAETPSYPVIDLVIPALDEQDNISLLLEALPWRLLRRVVVVDNGSVDQTARLARSGGAEVVLEPQRGYGAACLAGLRRIETSTQPCPDAVAFMDADLADDPRWLPSLWEPVVQDRADLVIASRSRLAEPGSLSRAQRVGNAVACGLMGLVTSQRFTDLGPMRVIRWSSLVGLEMADRTWGWTVEMQFKAALQRLRVVEMNVPYRCRRAGRSKISGSWMGSVKAGYKITTTIGKLWWQSRKTPGVHSRRGDGSRVDPVGGATP